MENSVIETAVWYWPGFWSQLCHLLCDFLQVINFSGSHCYDCHHNHSCSEYLREGWDTRLCSGSNAKWLYCFRATNSASWFSYDVRGMEEMVSTSVQAGMWCCYKCIMDRCVRVLMPSALGQLGRVWGSRTTYACLCRPEKLHSLIPVQNIQRIFSVHNDMKKTGK